VVGPASTEATGLDFNPLQRMREVAGQQTRGAKQMTQRYRIELESPKGTTEEASTRALRGLLKVALRVFALRCTLAEPITKPQEPTDPKDTK
jgi:hypothetical protein